MSKSKVGADTGVVEHDANYVGVAPEYQNSAYAVTAPIEEVADEVVERVRDHMAAMEQPQPGARSFEDWVTDRQALREGVPEEAEVPERVETGQDDGQPS